MDPTLTPVRGQTVLVRNEAGGMAATGATADGEGEMCYVMQRAVGACCPSSSTLFLIPIPFHSCPSPPFPFPNSTPAFHPG